MLWSTYSAGKYTQQMLRSSSKKPKSTRADTGPGNVNVFLESQTGRQETANGRRRQVLWPARLQKALPSPIPRASTSEFEMRISTAKHVHLDDPGVLLFQKSHIGECLGGARFHWTSQFSVFFPTQRYLTTLWIPLTVIFGMGPWHSQGMQWYVPIVFECFTSYSKN